MSILYLQNQYISLIVCQLIKELSCPYKIMWAFLFTNHSLIQNNC